MKYIFKIIICTIGLSLFLSSCNKVEKEIEFVVDTDLVEIGPDGGLKKIKISSNGNWTAITDSPWIKISPTNGYKTTVCELSIDSTILALEKRSAVIQIVSEGVMEPASIFVDQEGYERIIKVVKQPEILPSYEEYGKRTISVELLANVPFELSFDGDKPWVSAKDLDLESIINRGARPRRIQIDMEWENNTKPQERVQKVIFKVDESVGEISVHDELLVRQIAADEIVPGIKGDSLAIIACARNFGCDPKDFDPTSRMANWDGVVLWEVTDKDVKPENIGRVRKVTFKSLDTREEIPYEIRYLNALETLIIRTNLNTILRDIPLGSSICELTQLKNLQIFSLGLTELNPDFVKLKNLEMLDLSGNNFSKIPDILTPENFPNLTYLDLAANRKWTIFDMNTTVRPTSDWAGLCDATPSKWNRKQLETLFAWEKLELLRLSNNYMQYELPNMVGKTKNVWAKGDQYKLKWNSDTQSYDMHEIPNYLVGKPKVLPNATFMAVNLNYFTGKLPDWILYHPHLLLWDPLTLIFNQEKKYFDKDGKKVGFTNVPNSLDYYYAIYPEQKLIDDAEESSSINKSLKNKFID